MGSIPGSGRSPGVGISNPLQYSCLENPMDRGAWQTTAFGVAKSQKWLSDWAAKQTYVPIWSIYWLPDFYNKAIDYWVIQIFLARKSKFCDGKRHCYLSSLIFLNLLLSSLTSLSERNFFRHVISLLWLPPGLKNLGDSVSWRWLCTFLWQILILLFTFGLQQYEYIGLDKSFIQAYL